MTFVYLQLFDRVAPGGGLERDSCTPSMQAEANDMQIIVRDNNVDQALRALKKKLQREGVYGRDGVRPAHRNRGWGGVDSDNHPRQAGGPRLSRETDFLARWHAEREAYDAWGSAISETVTEALGLVIAPVSTGYFLKLPVQPRLKEDQKLIEKAFFRNKGYADPFSAITDKVGIRFVVLLGSEIESVERALRSIPGWTLSKDRDYEAEQNENPFEFNYAAVHYVVRPDQDEEHAGVRVPAGTPCEVQIKTLLQHAFSELTHDTIYKPQIQATSAMQRNAAKAMALLEATNDYFEQVAQQVENALAQVRQMTADLTGIYRRAVGIDPKPTVLEGMLLAAFEHAVNGDYLADIEALFAEKGFLPGLVRQRVADRNPIFAQPSVLLAYLVASRSTRRAENVWPLTPQELEPLLNDLGEGVS